MVYKITALRSKDLPSKFGGTWKLVEVKLEGCGDKIFELQGYGKEKEKLVVGSSVQGYLGEKSWTGQTGTKITPTLNKITAEYVLDYVQKYLGNTEARPAISGPVPTPAISNAISAPGVDDNRDPGDGFNDSPDF